MLDSPRPGYPDRTVAASVVDEWIADMKRAGVGRLCCLLPSNQFEYYRADLLAAYRNAFGPSNVCWTEVESYHLCDHATLERRILPFLHESEQIRNTG